VSVLVLVRVRTGNYDTTTTPEAEWLVVTNEGKAKEASVPPRRVRTVKDIMENEAIVKEAGLREEEVMALLLYTGPMFAKYNASLRRFPADRVEALRGNKYTTTIYCVVSGIIKLSRKMKLPADRKAYRGLGGLDLPEAFLKMDEHGVRGGVEFGMLSTTLDRSVAVELPTAAPNNCTPHLEPLFSSRTHANPCFPRRKADHLLAFPPTFHGRLRRNVAVQYAGKSIPTVFEIGLGAIDRGASVSFLSQYPGEEEILLPPRSYLEVVGGVSRQEAGPDGHLIRVISLKVNANASSSTIEQIESRRKEIFLSAAGDCLLDIRSKLEHRMNGDDVRKVLHHRQWDLKNKTHEKIRDSIFEETDTWLEGYRKRPPEWFNDEYCYARAVKELGELEKIAVGKFQYWLGENGEGDRLVGERMQIIERLTESEMRCKVFALLRDAEHCKVDSEERRSLKDGARELALGLCKRRGLVTKSEDEVDDLGESPIIASGVVGNVVDLKLLIAAGAGVDSISSNGSTSLHMACLMGHNDYIRDLVKAKADIFCVDGAGRTGLHLATEIGHHDTVALMLELGGRDLGMTLTNDGASCAFLACHREDGVDELKRIVDVCGVEILDIQDKEGRSCARKAAGRGNLRVLQYLSETAGRKNLELRMHRGSTIAMVAAMNNHLEVLKYISRELGKDFLMLEGTCGWTCLMVAAEYGHLDIVRYLFELCGSDMLMKVSCASAAGDQSVSCAWVASKFGHLEVVQYMAQVGGRPLLELASRDGRSCMRVAEESGHARVCEFIASFLGIGMPGESATASS
jgi:ankyrin repeat protein